MDCEPKQRRHGWRRFTFLGGSGQDSTSAPAPHSQLRDYSDPDLGPSMGYDGRPFPLSLAQTGDRVWIVGFTADDLLLERFVSMGLSRGAELRIVNRGAGGSLMVAVENTRFGLGAAMAEQIRVQRSVITIAPAAQATPSPRSDSQSTSSEFLSSPEPFSSEPSLSEPSLRTSTNHPTEEKSMQTQLHLRDLAVGSRGRIMGYGDGAVGYRRQLLAMGLTPGIEFTITRQAPLGDPVELHVRGFQLSLRKSEADALIVEALDHD